MAIATTTALAIGSLALTAGTTAGSFIQANKQRKLQQKAEDAAEKSMKEARKALGVNYFEELAVQKEKYDLEREATLQGQAGIMEGLQAAGARSLAAGVGRVGLAGQKAQQTTRTAMGKELSDLQKMTAQEESRLRDVGVQLDLAEVQGAQEAAAQAEELKAQAFREGIQGATSMVQQGLSMVPLYQQNMAAQKAAVGGMNFTPEEFAKFGTIGQAGGLAGSGQEFSDLDFASVGNMSNRQFRQFKKSLTPQQQAMIFGTSQFADAYKNFDTSSINPFQLR
jgi:hypothetical protein